MATKSFQVLGKIGVDDTIEVSKTEPTSEHAQVWINPDEDTTFNIPEVNDETVSPEDTWSSQKINQELEAKSGIKMEVVDALPATGDPKTMYLVPNGLTGANRYDEYMFVNGEPELLPPRIYELTEAEIDEICTDVADGTGSIPIATKSTIGCVAVGAGLDVDGNGVVSTEAVDYVIEEGDDGKWAYRKWNSGRLEAWNVNGGSVTVTSTLAYGSAYYSADVNLSTSSEASLFTEVHQIDVSINKKNAYGLWYPVLVKYSLTDGVVSLLMYAVNSVSNSSSHSIAFYVTIKGRWK